MAHPDEYLSIDTPENVACDYQVSGIGTRFLAAMVDTLIIVVLQVVVNLAVLLIATQLMGSLDDWDSGPIGWLVALFGLIAFAFLWGYYVFFEVLWNGQSPGKRWVGLRVIRADGTPITFVESLVRNLVRIIDFLPAYYGIGVVTMFINAQSRRLGDLAAGTLVVRDRGDLTLESLAVKPMPLRASAVASAAGVELPVARLTNQDIQMAEDFLRRRNQFSQPGVVAGRVVRALLDRMGVSHADTSPLDAETLIHAIVQASRERPAGDVRMEE